MALAGIARHEPALEAGVEAGRWDVAFRRTALTGEEIGISIKSVPPWLRS